MKYILTFFFFFVVKDAVKFISHTYYVGMYICIMDYFTVQLLTNSSDPSPASQQQATRNRLEIIHTF